MRNWTSLSPHTPPFRHHALAAALALALLHGAAQAAPTDPLGPAVKLNVGPPEAIASVSLDVELNDPGAGVVLWQEKQDDGRYATYFRRFDRSGNLAPLQTYSVTATPPSIKLLKVFDNGEFALESREGNRVKIHIRNKNGGFARKLWTINCKTADCRVAMDDEGDIVVVDRADPIPPYNYQYRHIVAQIRDASGRVVKPWFTVDQPADGVGAVLSAPSVAVDADGDFVVGWSPYIEDANSYYPYENNYVLLRQFHKTGQPRGEQFRDGAVIGSPELAMDADGDFVVSGVGWNYYGAIEGWSVYRSDGQRSASFGPSFGPGGRYSGLAHKVVMDDDGDYLRLYTENYYPYQLYSAASWFTLYGRFSLSTLGERTLAELHAKGTYPYQRGLVSDIAMDGSGHVAALWAQSVGEPTGLFLQRFTGPSGESCHGAGATLVGSDDADRLFGTDKDDVIQGKDGDDVIHGRGGDDIICGGRGRDKLYGDAGKDFAEGGPGQDLCVAETTNNCP